MLTKRQRKIAIKMTEIKIHKGLYYMPCTVGQIMRRFGCQKRTALAVWKIHPYARVLVNGVLIYRDNVANWQDYIK